MGETDTISRQAAIRWVKTECNPYGKPTLDYESGKKVIEHLEAMSSAQPDIIRCKDCKFSHMTNDGRYCKYCDQFTDDYGELVEMYFDSDFYCGYAERRTE